jgi:hypothetical protein
MTRKELARVLNALLMEIEDGKNGFALAARVCAVPRLNPLSVECVDHRARSARLRRRAQSWPGKRY